MTFTFVLRGRRGTKSHAWPGVALGDIHLDSRGRRGTIAHPRSFCVGGVGQMALGGALGLV